MDLFEDEQELQLTEKEYTFMRITPLCNYIMIAQQLCDLARSKLLSQPDVCTYASILVIDIISVYLYKINVILEEHGFTSQPQAHLISYYADGTVTEYLTYIHKACSYIYERVANVANIDEHVRYKNEIGRLICQNINKTITFLKLHISRKTCTCISTDLIDYSVTDYLNELNIEQTAEKHLDFVRKITDRESAHIGYLYLSTRVKTFIVTQLINELNSEL